MRSPSAGRLGGARVSFGARASPARRRNGLAHKVMLARQVRESVVPIVLPVVVMMVMTTVMMTAVPAVTLPVMPLVVPLFLVARSHR